MKVSLSDLRVMRKSVRRLLLLLMAVAIVAGFFVCSRKAAEPRYQGRSLSHWLEELDYSLPSYNNTNAAQAWKAVGAIGTNALPQLIRMLRSHDSALRKSVLAVYSKQKMVKFSFLVPAEKIQWRGARGIYALGKEGKAAAPDLIALLQHPDSWTREGAVWALGRIGPDAADAVPALINTLKGPLRTSSCWALSSIGRKAGAAAPALRDLLNAPDSKTRGAAMEALVAVSDEPSGEVPLLLDRLKDSDDEVRGSALYLLGKLHLSSTAVLDEVRLLRQDPDKWVRRTATNALEELEGKNETTRAAAEETGTIKLMNARPLDVLELYSEVSGKKVEMSSNVIARAPRVTMKTVKPSSPKEILKLIEEELLDQAGIIITDLDEQRVSATLRKK